MMRRVPTKTGALSATESTGNQISVWGLLLQLQGSTMSSAVS